MAKTFTFFPGFHFCPKGIQREKQRERERERKNNANDKSESKIGAWRLPDKRLTRAADILYRELERVARKGTGNERKGNMHTTAATG